MTDVVLCGSGKLLEYTEKKLCEDERIRIAGRYETPDKLGGQLESGVVLLADGWVASRLWIEKIWETGIDHFYKVPLQVRLYEMEITVGGQLLAANLDEMKREESYLEYLETDIEDACNLRCRGCMHFSNLVRERHAPDPDQFEADFRRMKELFPVIWKVRLLGGEPFLNPDIGRYISIVRRFYPVTDIRIATNGLLIPRLEPEVWQTLRKYAVSLDVTKYPPTAKMFDAIQETLEKYQIPYGTCETVEQFRKSLRSRCGSDAQKAMKVCGSAHCRSLRDGRIAKCPLPHMISRLNEKYRTEYEESGIYDIYLESDGWALKEKLDSSAKFCGYCPDQETFIPWRPTLGDDELADWVETV